MVFVKDRFWLNLMCAARKNLSNVWREKFLGNKWSQMNETAVFWKLVSYSKITDLRQLDILYVSLNVSGSKTRANGGEEKVS